MAMKRVTKIPSLFSVRLIYTLINNSGMEYMAGKVGTNFIHNEIKDLLIMIYFGGVSTTGPVLFFFCIIGNYS